MLPVPLNSWKISSSMREPVSTKRRGDNGQRAAFFDFAGGGEHFARNFQRARIDTAGHRAAAAAMHAVVGAGDAGDGIEQNENILARFHHAAAALDHETGQAHVRFQILIVGGSDHFRFDGALEIGDFLRAFVDEQHHAHARPDGWPSMALAICLRMVVLPVRGGATINPRVPLPIGVTRSMMRVSIRSGVVSRLNFSIGSIVVRFSNRIALV